MKLKSKLPEGGTTIFTRMSKLAAENQAINLGQGFPNFDCDDELKELVKKHLYEGKNQYCPMPGLLYLREVLSQKVFKLYDKEIKADTEITITAGATQALYTAITALVHPGDEVIIIEPAYDSYKPSVELQGGLVVPYELRGPDYKIDWESFESLVTKKTRLVIINTPHNPIGKTLKEEDIESLKRIVLQHELYLISDEVYEHLIFDGQKHQSILKYPELFERTLCVYSFGKTFHSTGWKMGYCIAPEDIMVEFRKVHQWNVFCVNSFLQYALADYLKDERSYLDLPNFYQEKRDLLANFLSSSPLRPLACEGSYFQLYDYSAISDEKDTDFAIRLVKENGVASIPVSVFYSEPKYDNVVRLCFAKTEDILSQAAERLIRL